jgi:MGT family glycosyltransferase
MVYNETAGLVETILNALGQGEYNLMVTVGVERDPAEFGAQPPTVHIEQYVPQAFILPRCDVMVCHGGSGTLMGALAHGLPMLVMPLNGDHFPSAARLAALDVAKVLQTPEATVDSIATTVRELLSNSAYRNSACRGVPDRSASSLTSLCRRQCSMAVSSSAGGWCQSISATTTRSAGST